MHKNDFDSTFNSMLRFMKGWIIFVALVTVAVISGGGWLLYLVLKHFGIIGA